MTGTVIAHEDVEAIAAAVEVLDESTILVAGERLVWGEHLDGAHRDAPDSHELEAAEGPEAALGALIYRRCYVRPYGPVGVPVWDAAGDRNFQAGLASAEPSARAWERGWRVERTDNDFVVVSRYGVLFWATLDDVRCSDSVLASGVTCEVLVPVERRRMFPGYHAVVGREGWSETEEDCVVRLYWHVPASSAALLITTVTGALDDQRIPFRIKVLRTPAAYVRADSAVLYLPSTRFDQAASTLAPVHAILAPTLRNSVPMFTKRIALGLSLAEDPGDGLSFGQHRSRLVARALWQARCDGGNDIESRVAAISAAFRREGLDPLKPYLSAGSRNAYDLKIEHGRVQDPSRPTIRPVERFQSLAAGGITSEPGSQSSMESRDSRNPIESPMVDDDTLVGEASRIGHLICDDALWDSSGKLCTWLARSPTGASGPPGIFIPQSATLGPDLYAGASGVALFLAELYARTGETRFASTARSGIASALNQLRTSTKVGGHGLFSGVCGVVWSGWRIGQLLGRQDANHLELRNVLAASLGRNEPPAEIDIISGSAGTILSLLSLVRDAGWLECLGLADRLGTELARATTLTYGEKRADTSSPLTGLSHGAAGIGLSLAELASETGREDLLQAARHAFDYEQRRFDPERRNWPDLRVNDEAGEARFLVAWCHGAPGIALSRLRASTADRDRREAYEVQADAALSTTAAEIRRTQHVDAYDVTACHGLSGLIEVLEVGGQVLGRRDYLIAARSAAAGLVHVVNAEMRSGTPCGGPNPSLMVGTAGVGYQMLRLADQVGVPSVLAGIWRVPSHRTRLRRHATTSTLGSAGCACVLSPEAMSVEAPLILEKSPDE